MEDGPVVGPFVDMLHEGGSVGRCVRVDLDGHVTGALGAVGIGPRQGHPHHFVTGQRRTAAGLTEGKKHGEEHHAHQPKRGQGWRSVLEEWWNEVLTDALLGHLVEQIVVGGVVPLGATIHLRRCAEVFRGLSVDRSRARNLRFLASRQTGEVPCHGMHSFAVGLAHEVDNARVLAFLQIRLRTAPSFLDLFARHDLRWTFSF